jgi:hypothetical protein
VIHIALVDLLDWIYAIFIIVFIILMHNPLRAELSVNGRFILLLRWFDALVLRN